MDLSFSFTHETGLVGWRGGLAALVRQAAAPPAPAGPQAGPAGPLSPPDGCFNGEMAAALSRWRTR